MLIAPCKGIRISESGNSCWWNPESWSLECGIRLKESGIPLMIAIQNSSSTDKNWNPVHGIRNPQRGIQSPRLCWISFYGVILYTHLTLERTSYGGCQPHKVFLRFLLEDKTSAPDVFSSCSFIPRSHFETSSVTVSCYGYEI